MAHNRAKSVSRTTAEASAASPDPPNPGHSWSDIGDLPGTMWHSNNDGSASGLDADVVDGLDSSQFLRSDVNDTFDALKVKDGFLELFIKHVAIANDDDRVENFPVLLIVQLR